VLTSGFNKKKNRRLINYDLIARRSMFCMSCVSYDCLALGNDICCSLVFFNVLQSKMIIVAALVASASAFAPAPAFTRSSALKSGEGPEIGAGGMADTRNPEEYKDDDPRKSISAAPSFEEYMKQRAAEQGQ
jgi:hypothetical protein